MKDYARHLIKREDDIGSLSKWVNAVRSLFWKRMKVSSKSMSVISISVFKDRDVAET